MEMGYYPGCSGAGSGVEYKLSTLKTAEMFGITLKELEDWSCCGATSAHSTNKLLSLALPARNLAIMEKANLDTMLAPCAACYSRHRVCEVEARANESTREQIEAAIGMEFNASTTTVSVLEWLMGNIGLKEIQSKVKRSLRGMKTACYYGCLLVRPTAYTGFDDDEDPKSLDQIMGALGAAVVDWPYKTECCGAALATSRPDIGNRMIYEVMRNAKEAGAECIVTACPLCMLNLDMRQSKVERALGVKLDIPIYYITEMVAYAGGYSPQEVGVNRHFVEALTYLDSLPAKAAALDAEEEARKPKKARAAAAQPQDEEAHQKKVAAVHKGILKNPDKIAARLIEDEGRAQVLAEIMAADEKKSLKIAELMVTDKDKAAKAADAFVTGELKKRGK